MGIKKGAINIGEIRIGSIKIGSIKIGSIDVPIGGGGTPATARMTVGNLIDAFFGYSTSQGIGAWNDSTWPFDIGQCSSSGNQLTVKTNNAEGFVSITVSIEGFAGNIVCNMVDDYNYTSNAVAGLDAYLQGQEGNDLIVTLVSTT